MAPMPPPPPPATMYHKAPTAGGARPDTSQLLREIERGVALKRVPQEQCNVSKILQSTEMDLVCVPSIGTLIKIMHYCLQKNEKRNTVYVFLTEMLHKSQCSDICPGNKNYQVQPSETNYNCGQLRSHPYFVHIIAR